MTDQEKVVRGLECCILHDPDDKPKCKSCPYDGACLNRLKRDALQLLKAQEPRVMTLEELYSQETVWFEEKPNHTMKQLTKDGIAVLVFVGLLHSWNGYGTVWRCWTSRPSEGQREEVAWND